MERNAPSPAATASLEISIEVARQVVEGGRVDREIGEPLLIRCERRTAGQRVEDGMGDGGTVSGSVRRK